MQRVTADGGHHLAAPRSRLVELGLVGLGIASVVIGVACALLDSAASGGFFLLGAALFLGMVLQRMWTDPSAWRLRPGDGERRVVLVVLAALVGLLAIGALFQIASAL